MLHEILYRVGVHFRNKKIQPNFKFLLQSQYWSREKLESYQNNKLRQLVSIAYNNSHYYKELLDDKKIKPEDIQSIKDLGSIPTTSKLKLLQNKDRIQLNDNSEKLYYSETSGSTGKPLVFYRNQDWDAWHNASVFRGYHWHGINPWDRNGYLWGYNLSKTQALKTKILDALQNRFRLFSYDDNEIEKFCIKLKKAKFLNGYSSMIYELAKHIENNKQLKNDIQLKVVKGTSEKIYDSYQTVSKKAFGRRIISEYGAAEAGIIAFECPEGNMHVNMETVIVEKIDDQIIITNLVSNSFPIIRYELGDCIQLDTETICSCGRQSPLIKEVTGRVGKSVYGIKSIYPSLTLYYIFKNIAIDHNRTLNYQGVQKKKGELELRIEQALSSEDRQLITNEIKKYFNDDMHYTITDNQTLVSRSGKTKDFVSDLE